MKNLITSLLLILFCTFCNSIFAQNLSTIDSLENVLKTAKEDTNKVNILIRLSSQFISMKKYNEALEYANTGLLLSKKLNFRPGLADSYSRKAVISQNQFNYPEAKSNNSILLKILEETGDKKRIAKVYFNLGRIYLDQSDYNESMKYYLISLKLREEMGSKKETSDTYNAIGVVNLNQGNYIEAIKNLYISMKIKEEIGDKEGVSASYNNIGVLYKMQNKIPEALNSYFKSLHIAEEIGNKVGAANNYLNIATIYKNQGNYSQANINYKASLKIYEENGNKLGICDCYNNLGNLFQDQGENFETKGDSIHANEAYKEALKNHMVALKIREELGIKDGIASSYLGISKALGGLQNFNEARIYLNKSLVIVKETGNKDYLKGIYASFAELDSAQAVSPTSSDFTKIQCWSSAYNALIKYMEIKDSLLNIQNNEQIIEVNTRYETEKKDKEIELLNRENELKALQAMNEHASFLAVTFESEKKKGEILLLNNANEIKEVQLSKTKVELKQQKTEAEKQAFEMALIKKDKIVKDQLLEKQKLLRNGIVAGVALLGLFSVLFFNRYQLRKKLEKQDAILKERKRISSDMHDDLASGLTSIRMLSEIAQSKSQGNKIDEIDKISRSAESLMENMRDIIWTLNVENNTLEDLVFYIRKYAGDFLDICSIDYRFNIPEFIPAITLSAEKRRNIFLSVKESLHNIAKHAGASLVTLNFNFEKDIQITIVDNGKGVDLKRLDNPGHGLKNMKSRMDTIRGSFKIENKIGTTVELCCPLSEKT